MKSSMIRVLHLRSLIGSRTQEVILPSDKIVDRLPSRFPWRARRRNEWLEGSRIINLSSSTTAIMLRGYAAYVATKGAEQFSHALAKRFGPTKITVNIVSGANREQKQRFAQMAAL
jgi:NAD(P)-dependent dehydrogenase (short-subunit alcohol dehydrogenase family)